MIRTRKHRSIYRWALLIVLFFLLLLTYFNFSLASTEGIYLPLAVHNWPIQNPSTAPLLISEVLFNPDSDEPAGEWIELYNRGDSPLTLADYLVGDAESFGDREGMFCFPQGSTIGPGQVIVIANQADTFLADYGFVPDFEMASSHPDVPDLIKCVSWASGGINLNNTEDEVIILGRDFDVLDAVSWGSSAFAFNPPAFGVSKGHSLERRPGNMDSDSAMDWLDQPDPKPGEVDLSLPIPYLTGTPSPEQTTTYPVCGEETLLVSEVLYDPIGSGEPDSEWLEIFNPSRLPVDLACIRVGDEELAGGGEGMLSFPGNAILIPSEVFVIAHNGAAFFLNYGFYPDFEMVDSDPDVPDMIKYISWSGGSVNLNNTGDEVLLLNNQDTVIDSVSWGNSNFSFDPSIELVQEGHSLERMPADLDNDTALDWIDQISPNPGQVHTTEPISTPTVTQSPTNQVKTSTATATLTRTPTMTPTGTRTSTPSSTPIPCGNESLLLTEVMYDPDIGVDPDGEWVEIYNESGIDVYLACVKIGDEETAGGGEGMFTFPPSGIIHPGEVVVVANRSTSFYSSFGFKPDFEMIDSDPYVPDTIRYTSWASGNVNLSNQGDDVLILNHSDAVLDALSWGSSTFAFNPSAQLVNEGHSLERIPANQDNNVAADWMDQPAPSPGSINLIAPTETPTSTPTGTVTPTATKTQTPAPAEVEVLITEVLYNPLDDISDREWIEIFNTGSSPIDLSNFKIGDEETSSGSEGMFKFPDGASIEVGEVLVVANNATSFHAVYGFFPDFEMSSSNPLVPDMIMYTAWSSGNVNMSNSGDEVLLLGNSDSIVDLVAYGNSPYPNFQPAVPAVSSGHSIARVPADGDTNTFLDWIEQLVPNPGEVDLLP